jgi:hypothetical protein
MSNGSFSNTVFDKVLSFIAYTNQHIFLTGKAGTGKTTLLKKITESSTKKMAVVAPTGVAAMNAKGTTINSFFQLPPGSFFPGDLQLENLQAGILSISAVVSDMSYSREKISLFNELELLVIDEISMVRCDLLDVIDAILRAVRKSDLPFGGVQMLLIGDLYQLPPVTKREDWAFLNRAYASPYFFDAHVVRRNPLLQIELTKVFRQTEPEFINILNDIRNNQIDQNSLEILNRRYDPLFNPSGELSPIIITSHNAEANAVNTEKLHELPGEEYSFEGEVSGDFRDLGLQAEQTLKLKEGAQIMFIKNDTGDDRKFYNGKIGKVKSITAGEILISFPQEEDMVLEKSSWQSFEYKTDPEQVIVQQQVGEFSQYPIKLAWAVTIHKSQGLTFDNAIIDAGKSFVSGQVYVALSRVRTLNGLVLKSKITTESLRSNPEVIRYMAPAKEEDLDQVLISQQESFILQKVLAYFSFQKLSAGLESISSNPEVIKSNITEINLLLGQLRKSVHELTTLSSRFQSQLRQLLKQNGFKDQPAIQSRVLSAVTYFSKEVSTLMLQPMIKYLRIKPQNKIHQQIHHLFQKQRQLTENQLALLQIAAGLLDKPLDQKDYLEWLDQQKNKTAHQPSGSSGGPQAVTLQLF